MITGTAVNVTVRYGGVPALRDVSIALAGGTVHALVGENGAGKSTLMKVLAGAIVPDTGTIALDGVPRRWRSPKDAHKNFLPIFFMKFSIHHISPPNKHKSQK